MTTPSGKTVCLCMIVKNEAPVIRRCLDSVRPLIDHWLIVDTGSTDGTQDIVRDHFLEIPGEVVERPWRDFAHNRTEALALARPYGDYSLIIDADDAILRPRGFKLPELDADSYTVDISFGGVRYRRQQFVRAALPWRFEGVLHEYLVCEQAETTGHLPLILAINHDGARRRDPDTYRKDAAVLERALEEETHPFKLSRYTFYLAQSYRDAGDHERAIALYLKRAEMGFWDQEVFVSLLQAARLQQATGAPLATVLDTLERATRACPYRAEALHEASRLCRLAGENARGAAYGKAAIDLALPEAGLFVEPSVYQWSALDEYSINAYWAGDDTGALNGVLRALAGGHVPETERNRLLANAGFALDRLGRQGGMASAGSTPAAAHALAPPRDLQVRLRSPAPRVLLAVLAKQKEAVLPFYLRCIERLDYPKSSIVLYIRTNNNTDRTKQILEEWIARVGSLYADVEFDGENVDVAVEAFGVHEWNVTRFRVLNHIRDVSLGKTAAHGCDYYFTTDCDNFVRPATLRNLVALDLPIVAPLLRHIDPAKLYSNYHAAVDDVGFYRDHDTYLPVLYRHVTGLIEMPCVHCTYVVRADVIPRLGYNDGTDRYDYIIFSDRARKGGIPQYFDNRQVYGYITLDDADPILIEGQLKTARKLMDGR